MLRKIKWKIPEKSLAARIIDAKAPYRAAARRLKNTGLGDVTLYVVW